MIAFLFPGQGRVSATNIYNLCQDNLYIKRKSEWFEKDVLQRNFLKKIEKYGDEDTSIVQPLIISMQLSLYSFLQETQPVSGCRPDMVAGHSLGEFSAAAASGIISYESAVILTNYRGHLCRKIITKYDLFAVLTGKLSIDRSLELLKELKIQYYLALYNTSSEVVIAMHPQDSYTVQMKGIKLIGLNIEAFHTKLMHKIAIELQEFSKKIPILNCMSYMPMILNRHGEIESDAYNIMDSILDQIANTVYWTKVIESFRKKGITGVVEFPPGKRLSRFLLKEGLDIEVFNLDTNFSYDDFSTFYKKHKS